jgi:hypothetical protein
VGGDGGVFRRVGLVGLAILNGKRSYEGRGGGRGEKRKRAAKTERDTVGRQTGRGRDRQTDRRQVGGGMCFCRLRLPSTWKRLGRVCAVV